MRVVIAGAGAVGRHLALDLHARGHAVTVIEQNTQHLAEASGGHLDEDLTVTGFIEVETDHLPLPRRLEQNSGPALHQLSPPSVQVGPPKASSRAPTGRMHSCIHPW